MGRYLLCTKEADTPYEVEELDLRVYSIEELAYLIYHDLPLLPDEFIDEKLLTFIEKELEMPEISGKIRRFTILRRTLTRRSRCCFQRPVIIRKRK